MPAMGDSPGVQAGLPPLVAGASGTRRRWAILRAQLRVGHEPCFQSDRRYGCPESACPWRDECTGLRAEWRR